MDSTPATRHRYVTPNSLRPSSLQPLVAAVPSRCPKLPPAPARCGVPPHRAQLWATHAGRESRHAPVQLSRTYLRQSTAALPAPVRCSRRRACTRLVMRVRGVVGLQVVHRVRLQVLRGEILLLLEEGVVGGLCRLFLLPTEPQRILACRPSGIHGFLNNLEMRIPLRLYMKNFFHVFQKFTSD